MAALTTIISGTIISGASFVCAEIVSPKANFSATEHRVREQTGFHVAKQVSFGPDLESPKLDVSSVSKVSPEMEAK